MVVTSKCTQLSKLLFFFSPSDTHETWLMKETASLIWWSSAGTRVRAAASTPMLGHTASSRYEGISRARERTHTHILKHTHTQMKACVLFNWVVYQQLASHRVLLYLTQVLAGDVKEELYEWPEQSMTSQTDEATTIEAKQENEMKQREEHIFHKNQCTYISGKIPVMLKTSAPTQLISHAH